MKSREEGHGDPKPHMPLNFHLNAMAMATNAADIRDGRARSNLPKYTNKSPSRTVAKMTQRTPHHGKRICLSSAVITLSSGNVCNLFSYAVDVNKPIHFIRSRRIAFSLPRDCSSKSLPFWTTVVTSLLHVRRGKALDDCG
jgi:hypothetical protein